MGRHWRRHQKELFRQVCVKYRRKPNEKKSARSPHNTDKTAKCILLSWVYNQFPCSLACATSQVYNRTVEYLAVFNISIT
jgi:hypothetical protein